MSAGALVALLLGASLFLHLGEADVSGDEPIYSFAVDRMLETGDWLTPRSSPREDEPFFEKPPLQIWIVAGTIRAGLLPHDEFGLRAWDALFGTLTFLYVFAIGARLAGPVCGVVSVLLLFVHAPLVLGIRANTMEGLLLLGYCGGVFHFLGWLDVESRGRRTWHALAVALWFAAAFITKFVAALFLPLVLAASCAIAPACRARLVRDRRRWIAASAVAAGLIAPWFAYQHVAHGAPFWRTLLAEHVLTRFSGALDPGHIHPWWFYVVELALEFGRSGAALFVAPGLVILAIDTVRRRWSAGAVVLLWALLPLALMSLTTSKLYHYAFPFVPPVALAGGYVFAKVGAWFVKRAGLWAIAIPHRFTSAMPAVERLIGSPALRMTMLVLASLAAVLACVTIVYGPVRTTVAGRLIRSSRSVRPASAALGFALLAGRPWFAKAAAIILLVALLPMVQAHEMFDRFAETAHPRRSTRDCLLDVQQHGATGGLFVDADPAMLRHDDVYYFRRVRPWLRAPGRPSTPLELSRIVHADQRPVLISTPRAIEVMRTAEVSADGDAVRQLDLGSVSLLLPGPYARCATSSATAVR